METDAQLTRLGLFDARVPRYTSYPTAPQFAGGVTPEVFESWIAAIPEGAAISLYLHVPFCRRLCWFCACRTQGTSSLDPVLAYVETLKTEIALLARRLPRGITLSRLHWGGGEIEKAHPDIYNILLQVLDDGQLTDGLGRKVDFKNTIIIMTSNIGARQLKDFGAGVGFATAARVENEDEENKAVIEKALKRTFSPEFLNRIDDVVIFNSLSKENIFSIIDISMKGVLKRIQNLGYGLELSEDAKTFLADKGYDQQFGARPLHRAIQKYLEDPLAEEILNMNVKPGDILVVDYDKENDKLFFTVKKEEEKAAEA